MRSFDQSQHVMTVAMSTFICQLKITIVGIKWIKHFFVQKIKMCEHALNKCNHSAFKHAYIQHSRIISLIAVYLFDFLSRSPRTDRTHSHGCTPLIRPCFPVLAKFSPFLATSCLNPELQIYTSDQSVFLRASQIQPISELTLSQTIRRTDSVCRAGQLPPERSIYCIESVQLQIVVAR